MLLPARDVEASYALDYLGEFGKCNFGQLKKKKIKCHLIPESGFQEMDKVLI